MFLLGLLKQQIQVVFRCGADLGLVIGFRPGGFKKKPRFGFSRCLGCALRLLVFLVQKGLRLLTTQVVRSL